MTVSPLAGVDSTFANGDWKIYSLRVDGNGDAVEDITYNVRASKPVEGRQRVCIFRATGSEARSRAPHGDELGCGWSNRSFSLDNGGKAFAGLRSDPFFFDLSGFLGAVEGRGEDGLGENPSDFFAELNTLAFVIEVPDARINRGRPFSVWATTSHRVGGRWMQVDRIGRPAINAVVNSAGPIVGASPDAKNLYNAGRPSTDVANFRGAAIHSLLAFSSLDTEGAYSDVEAGALADVLLPDVLPFDKAGTLPAPLNGRALTDDVIDTELRVVTGGDPLGLFAGRDADGAVNGDGVGPHSDYLDMFPYLGTPHV